jgi:hypothetical protein
MGCPSSHGWETFAKAFVQKEIKENAKEKKIDATS